MRTEITRTIQVPANEVWATISKGGDVHHWFTGVITSCALSGTGEGAERFCTMADGAELKERIIEIDHDARRFRYAIDEHPLPASHVIATIFVVGLSDGRAQVTWGADYATDDENSSVVDETLKGLYAHGVSALETYHQKTI
ncbi:MAG: SRPBCC family protein [bacterium]